MKPEPAVSGDNKCDAATGRMAEAEERSGDGGQRTDRQRGRRRWLVTTWSGQKVTQCGNYAGTVEIEWLVELSEVTQFGYRAPEE